jgi:hypothetical protein
MHKTTAFVLVLCLSFAGLQGQEPPSSSINPALLYWQAAAMAPTLTEEQASVVRDMASGKAPVDPAKVQALGIDTAVRRLPKAAYSSAPCDWGLTKEDGPGTPMPHLSKVRELASFALVHGETLIQRGKTAEGMEWFLIAHRIARHSGTGETLISYLVQLSIEDFALRAAARHCLGWDEATRQGYADKLGALPPLRSLKEAFRGELLFADWLEASLKVPAATRQELLGPVFAAAAGTDGKGAPAQTAESAMAALITHPELLEKETVAFRALHRRVEASLDKPRKEAKPEFEALDADIKNSPSMLVKVTFPSIRVVYDRQFSSATLRTMLEAALKHGPGISASAAAECRDALEDQPLRLQKAADGSVSLVAAKADAKGKPIELKLGK